ncbi:hypothetical protein CLI82_09185 [Porphyromonas gingivalis]|nr:hypothetical protein CLI82_09185 [Porphyromonas gingivalis]
MHGNWCVFYLLIHCIIGGYFVYLCRTDVSLCSLYCFSYYLPSTNFINERQFGVRKRQCIRSLISGLHTKILGVIGCSVQAIV